MLGGGGNETHHKQVVVVLLGLWGFLRWLAFWPLTNDQFKPINVQFYVNTTNVGYSTVVE